MDKRLRFMTGLIAPPVGQAFTFMNYPICGCGREAARQAWPCKAGMLSWEVAP